MQSQRGMFSPSVVGPNVLIGIQVAETFQVADVRYKFTSQYATTELALKSRIFYKLGRLWSLIGLLYENKYMGSFNLKLTLSADLVRVLSICHSCSRIEDREARVLTRGL
jgi:hypothetical protein